MESGKSVLITGAAGGVGFSLTAIYRIRKWAVYATDIREDPRTAYMDVTSDSSVEALRDQLLQQNVHLDLIICNAGIDRYFPFSEAPVSQMKEIFEVNFFGAHRVIVSFLPLLRKPGGMIILVGSESLNLIAPFMPYPLTKNCLERYGKVLRQELRFLGVKVTVVRPGAIDTPLLKALNSISWPVKDPRLAAAFERFTGAASRGFGKVLTPGKAAYFIYKVSLKTRPKPLYRINNMWKLRLAALIPFSLTERIIHRMIR